MVNLSTVPCRCSSSTGTEGEFDLRIVIGRDAFAPLANPGALAKMGIDEFSAVSWSAGADLTPGAICGVIRYDNLASRQISV